MGIETKYRHPFFILNNNDKKIFYLSHAISAPRRHFKDKHEWVEPVSTVNLIQKKLLDNSIACILPTAIDEYRFQKTGKNYSSNLTERWPLPEDVGKILSENNLISSDVDFLNAFALQNITYDGTSIKNDPVKIETGEIQEYVNGVLSSLEMSIVEQLANQHLTCQLILCPFSEGRMDHCHHGTL